MSQVAWGPSMETANGKSQNVNGRKLENNILKQEIDLSDAILPWSMNLDWEPLGFSAAREPAAKAHASRPRNHRAGRGCAT